jgi:hypothetical protein
LQIGILLIAMSESYLAGAGLWIVPEIVKYQITRYPALCPKFKVAIVTNVVAFVTIAMLVRREIARRRMILNRQKQITGRFTT